MTFYILTILSAIWQQIFRRRNHRSIDQRTELEKTRKER